MYCTYCEPLFCDCLGQVARLFKGDEVADWNSLRNDPSAIFVRRMYKYGRVCMRIPIHSSVAQTAMCFLQIAACDTVFYSLSSTSSAATAKFMSLDKKWDALPEPRDLVFH